MRGLVGLIGASVLASGLVGARARAQTPSALGWTRLEGAGGCIAAPELARRVEARVGAHVLVSPSQASLSIEGRVGPRAGGWRAVVALARADGELLWERTLDTREPSCRALDDALVLVIALSLDPEGAPQAPPPREATPRVIVREVVREVEVHEPWHLGVRSGLDAVLGALPSLSFGGRVGVLVDPPGLPPVALGVFGLLDRSADASLAGRGVAVGQRGGSLAVCPRLALGGVGLEACGGLRLGWMTWEGHGFERPTTGGVLVPAGTADLQVRLPVSARVAITGGVGAHVPLRRVSISYQRSAAAGGGGEELFAPWVVSAWAGLGLAVSIF